ncbi:MAG: hypothetical protein GJ676_20005 [Rhodobacteraceae bacterium]|nr:hypothetical protein [Paracoccaceae bacterium]
MKLTSAAILFTFVASSVFAACPGKPPNKTWNTQAGDQAVTNAWLEKTLTNKKVKFETGGVEHYRKDGTYRFTTGGQRYDATGYQFYSNGVRCIAYSTPRFDRYVVNNGQLVLINWQGSRYDAKIR